uniref:Uncharacterized protein n=1 Tax=Vespula pensylvanica TaxID=30213 RepID=A0A834NYH8_VESPE|nr:hypothetical protein H0235_009316 [Vespula pensylvanica]
MECASELLTVSGAYLIFTRATALLDVLKENGNHSGAEWYNDASPTAKWIVRDWNSRLHYLQARARSNAHGNTMKYPQRNPETTASSPELNSARSTQLQQHQRQQQQQQRYNNTNINNNNISNNNNNNNDNYNNNNNNNNN